MSKIIDHQKDILTLREQITIQRTIIVIRVRPTSLEVFKITLTAESTSNKWTDLLNTIFKRVQLRKIFKLCKNHSRGCCIILEITAPKRDTSQRKRFFKIRLRQMKREYFKKSPRRRKQKHKTSANLLKMIKNNFFTEELKILLMKEKSKRKVKSLISSNRA